jgi:teichuronic acid biosynthesis glycosyltransferase TuaC
MTNSGIKVLFVSSGKNGRVSDVVLNQGESLKDLGIEVDYFLVRPGFTGYISAIPRIRKKWRTDSYNLVHAHYGLSALAASVAGRFPIVVSLMGSDIFMSAILRAVIRFFYRQRWNITIVKTNQMKELARLPGAEVIPNGVDINRFKPLPVDEARNYLGYPLKKKLVLFNSSPDRPEKNARLAAGAVSLLGDIDLEIKYLYDIHNTDVPYYLNAADTLLLTSKWEGSANVIKEAMACNCPIVSTDVGDIRWVTEDTPGCFLTSFDVSDVADKLRNGLEFGSRTNGRDRIIQLGIDAGSIAVKIKSLYERVIC